MNAVWKGLVMIVWKENPNGYCPVQALGWINDRAFYFRSRWKTSTITIADNQDKNRDPLDVINLDNATEHDLKEFEDSFAAGWIEHEEAKELIINFANNLGE